MKSLITYINESFIDYDTALADVPEKMKDVAKLRILIKKFDELGEECEYAEGKDPFDRLMQSLSYTVSQRKFDELDKERRNSYSSDYNEKVKNRTKYCDKVFSAIYSDYKKELKRGWNDPLQLTQALIGIAYWIEKFSGFKDAEADKYLGKLCTKFEKCFNISADDVTQITKMYDKQKVSITQAVDAENKVKASVQEIKDDFKNHKYTIFGDSNESSASMYIVENSDYESLDDAFEKTVAKETDGSPIYKYDLDKKLRQLTKDGKINALYLCSGYYCFGEDKEKTIPTFGYYDEKIEGQEIYKYSTYDSKYYYTGKINKKTTYLKGQGNAYHWYDSLWTVHNK